MTNQAKIMTALTDVLDKNNLLRKPLMEKAFEGLSLSEIQSLEILGQMKEANVSRLAEQLYMTRGAASKITKKLIAKGLVKPYNKSDNKKEIYFELTTEGKAINKRHDKLHDSFLKQDKGVFEAMSASELEVIDRFLTNYNKHLDMLLKEGLG